MEQNIQVKKVRSTLLFLLFPLFSEILFINTIIRDAYARRRIRIMVSLFSLVLLTLAFSVSELFYSLELQSRIIPLEISYLLTGCFALILLLLFISEGWTGKVSLEEQIMVKEDRISLSLANPRDVFITLHRILNAAQYRRYRYDSSDNSRLASYALTVLSEYLKMRMFPSTMETK